MTIIDKRGGQFTLLFTPVIDAKIAMRFLTSGTPIDISGQDITAHLYYEGQDGVPKQTTYNGTITDAGDGRAEVSVPASYFKGLDNDGFGETVGILISRASGTDAVEQIGGIIELTEVDDGGGTPATGTLSITVESTTIEIGASDGLPGTAATIAVGTVSSLPAGSTPTIVNSGTSAVAVFDFGLTVGDTGAQGNPGADGADGLDGSTAGTPYTFSTTTTDSDPGSGNVRINNADPSLATEIYIDNLDRGGSDVSAWLDSLDNSTTVGNKGLITFRKSADPNAYVCYTITGTVVDATGYRRIPVSFAIQGTAISDADEISVSFSRTGDKGTDGLGAGDVVGPASAVDSNFAAFDTVTGKLIKDSGSAASTFAAAVHTHTASQVTDFDSAVSSNAAVAANTAKITNATHTGDVTGSTALTIADDAVTFAKMQNISANVILGAVGAGAVSEITCTAAGRALIDDADASAQRTTLGLGSIATVAEATVAEWRNNTASRALTTDVAWSAAAEVTLTDAATIAVDMDTFMNATVTLAGNRTLGNPTNEKVGQSGHIRVVQDATGTRTLSLASDYETAGSAGITLSTAANAEDLLFYKVLATNRVFISLAADIG